MFINAFMWIGNQALLYVKVKWSYHVIFTLFQVLECQGHKQRSSFENLSRIKLDDLITVIYGDSH